MPLHIASTAVWNYFPTQYYVHITLSVLTVAIIRAYCQGRTTNRERDMHGRVVLLTGGFTSVGLTLMEALAVRGAHVIALSPHPIDAPQVALVVDALRARTANEHVHAEYCDLASPASVRAFCTAFLTGQEQRLDAVVFAHEYEHVGPLVGADRRVDEERRAAASMSTFLMTTLLLPALLVAPPERDIRIINVVNPFYAAAVPTFSPSSPPPASTFVREGYRSLRTAIFVRHLQRVLDALPSAPAPNPDAPTTPLSSSKEQKSNIVAISVSPGISRTDTIAPLLHANGTLSSFSVGAFILYLFLQPILRIVTRSPFYAIQSILHVLFLPTPFKRAVLGATRAPTSDELPEEILKPGALYTDCSVVRPNVMRVPAGTEEKPEAASADTQPSLPDDGELGGGELGRLIWESYEAQLKIWERDHPAEATPQTAEDANAKKAE